MTQRILILSHDNKIGVLCGGKNAALYRLNTNMKLLCVQHAQSISLHVAGPQFLQRIRLK